MRLLCTGDLHLGRNPTRLPADRLPDQTPFSTRAMWDRIVTLAIDEQVDALLISGDLVDHDNRYFEALGPIESGIDRLKNAGVPVIAVAGNHDYNVLPRVADRSNGGLKLLGRSQQWERLTLIDASGRPTLHIDGWSFANERVLGEPLASYRPEPGGHVPVIGLLHTDLDRTGSKYAPSRLSDLQAMPVAAWLIGHVHAPAQYLAAGRPPVLYPGSPQPLDPGEPGEHGVWLLDIGPDGLARFSLRPIATIRYQSIEFDLSGATDIRDAATQFFDGVRADADAMSAPDLDLLLYRVRLIGRTALDRSRHAEFEAVACETDDRWAIDTLIDDTRPAIDLAEFADESSPAGVIAGLLQSLEAGDTAHPLLTEVAQKIENERGQSSYYKIAELPPPEATALLSRVAWRLLEELVAERERAS